MFVNGKLVLTCEECARAAVERQAAPGFVPGLRGVPRWYCVEHKGGK